MRQAMSTLCRQLHDPTARDPIYRWSIASLHKSNFEALVVFHYTVTAINELREPLHDEVFSTVFRLQGDRLSPVEASFEASVLESEFLAVQSQERREQWVRRLRAKWFDHRKDLESFLTAKEKSTKADLQERAKKAQKREIDAAAESYRVRLDELRERNREKELRHLAEALFKEQAAHPALFEEMQQDAKVRLQDIEQQIDILRRDVEETRAMLTRERDSRLKVLLPKRFQIRDVRVLPLAVEYVIPAAKEDLA